MKSCYLCHKSLRYDLHLSNEYALACNNYDCPGKIDSISFNYRVQDGEVTHYFLPIYYNNKLYSIVSSQQQFGHGNPNTAVRHYPHHYNSDVQTIAEIPKFYPANEHNLHWHAFNMIERFIDLKAFL